MKLAEANQNNREYSFIEKLLRADCSTLSEYTSQRVSQLWFKSLPTEHRSDRTCHNDSSQAAKYPPPSDKELRLTTGVVAVAD
jgi:hypothetical protein